VVLITIYKNFINSANGPLKLFFDMFNWKLPSLLYQEETATATIVFYTMFMGLGGNLILFSGAMAKIPPEKDVDGFSALDLGHLVLNKEKFVACTPLGVMKMLEFEGIDPTGKHAVVLGRSDTVGKPMALLLLNAHATVTVCHSKTQDLASICKTADILVSAIGKANFVKADMVKDGAVVIDVGMNRDENGKLCGDVDFDAVSKKASYITPVPGGVGPMTITTLLYNTYKAAVISSKE
jgi:methylenetetrahydrofolate dehydrogenase (NADP+)/methenyltetrahydrofolate cyclohydrolase